MSLCKLGEHLFQNRSNWESLWDLTYRYVAPERGAIFASGRKLTATEIQSDVFDSTAIESAEKLVNLLMSGLIPPWAKWFRIQPRDTLDEGTRTEMLEPLQLLERRILQALSNSNFYQETQPALLDEVVGGTGGISIREHNGALTFRCIPLSELAIHEDSLGRVSHVVRKGTIDMGSIRRLYKEKIQSASNERWQAMEQKKDTETVETYEVSVRGVDEQWTYTRVIKGEPEITLETQVTRYSRLVAFRWSKVPGYPYGRGPGLRALSDVRALNKLKELTLKNAALAVSGVFTVVNDGVLNPHTLSIQPGALIPVATNSPNDPSVLPLPSFADFNVSNFSMDDLRNSIKAAFMADQFQPLGRTPMSATEVAERTRVIASDMGASLARLQNELLLPVLGFVLDWLQRKGLVPEGLDLNDDFTEIQFVSRLAQAQWGEDRANLAELTQYAGAVGQVDPRAALVLDGEQAVREYAELIGTPVRLMRSSDDIDTLMEQAQQAQQNQGVVDEGLTA